MTDPGDADSVPGPSSLSRTGMSFTSGRGLAGRVTGLSSPPPPPGRLSSLRSRDLTLGGFKKPKKTFEPNINAVRKSKDDLKEEINITHKKDRREREERNRERRGRRRERPQTIQSHSIFEQGPADTVRKTAWHGGTDLCDTSTASVCKLIKKEGADSEEDEDTILSKLQRDDFIDDPGLRNDSKLKPIQLPLYQSSNFFKTETPAGTTECKEALPSSSPGLPLFRTATQNRTELPRPEHPSLAEVFQELSLSGREELFFIQLPDCMPGSPPVSKGDAGICPMPEKPGKKEGKAQDKRTAHLKVQEAVVKESCPVLSYFSEGLLGKLHIRKSGKVQLKLGHIVMDVSEGAAFSFLQELVSVRLNDSQTGDMTVLGNVNHKLVFSPDFQTLLQHTPAQPPAGHR
ncbi:DNA-directed RNA polymerase III subunit RPC4 [Lampris incognitus]|uniref:DNA-directed RNA polymerase III subunit RPC4 n=1 Tax=Lampris incognitus TaxID=2546036 RepID=UPI0024B52BE4|nr:DNA-directed RNA polymerase III subunit RPC4 [Lampris incognitus]XP_056153126.1 DNA-directed RNA polymerase III subunit RPC4 [Lampris incognitus]